MTEHPPHPPGRIPAGAPGDPLDRLIDELVQQADLWLMQYPYGKTGGAGRAYTAFLAGFPLIPKLKEALRAAGEARQQEEQIYESTDGRSMVADASGVRGALSDANRVGRGRGADDAVDRAGIAGAARPQQWTCFHCEEVFTDEAEAREHFGRAEMSTPGCAISLAEFRQMEEQANDLRCENETLRNDSDAYHSQSCELERLFGKGARTAHQAWLRLEAMESRAMAAEEKLAAGDARRPQLQTENHEEKDLDPRGPGERLVERTGSTATISMGDE